MVNGHHTVKGGNLFVVCTMQDGECADDKGNIILGYDAGTYLDSTTMIHHKDITGNHNLILGGYHTISGSHNIVSGDSHRISGSKNIVSGGSHKISGFNNVAGGGWSNTIESSYSAIITGTKNKVTTYSYTAIIGGDGNTGTPKRCVANVAGCVFPAKGCPADGNNEGTGTGSAGTGTDQGTGTDIIS